VPRVTGSNRQRKGSPQGTLDNSPPFLEKQKQFRYLDEMEFRFNHRGTRFAPVTDGERFDLAVRQIVGKRITYKQLTGKTSEGVSEPF